MIHQNFLFKLCSCKKYLLPVSSFFFSFFFSRIFNTVEDFYNAIPCSTILYTTHIFSDIKNEFCYTVIRGGNFQEMRKMRSNLPLQCFDQVPNRILFLTAGSTVVDENTFPVDQHCQFL